ncbi:MAG: sulfotransferase domain protein [Bacteroidetes bacterium]|nr:sulfotransferase domain protein [Bacteroidota bacterium]
MPESTVPYELIYSQHGLPAASAFRKITSGLRMRPSLFIAGAQKAGTTSLAGYLSNIPGVIPPHEKEISYFNNDQRFRLGDNWYRSFFATNFVKNKLEKKTGILHITYDATANYFEEIKAAERIKKFNPDAKVIVVLRNPVDRAWSHYKMAVKYGFEKNTFRDALDEEAERILSNTAEHNFAFQRLGYRSKGEYLRFLPAWMNAFGNNVLVVFFEELFSDSIAPLQQIHDFLKLKTAPDLDKLKQLNKGSEDQLNAADRDLLNAHYKQFNNELALYLKRDLPW